MGHDQGMQRQKVWPARYRVTARAGLGPTRNLRVVTWLGPEKVIAMAVRACGRGFGFGTGEILRVDIGGRPAMSAAALQGVIR